ncbi:MAG: protoporphyrinogen oxidase [Nitrospiraceae bacterium]|nr:protoporphyrinogen oxidase [Nitrospiraceae bacterium]
MKIAIAGGGISGLSLAYYLIENSRGKEGGKARVADPVVLEAGDRPGGKIRTEKAPGGYLCEWGVNGFLDNRPRTIEAAGNLGLNVLRSSDSSRRRFIFLKGGLKQLPENPKAFLTSGVLGPAGKIRVALEPFIAACKDDETLARFAVRRLGRQAYENLIDPMASGIFAGDPERMSVESCFPKIKAMERKYGSLIKAMISLGRQAKKAGKGPVGAGPGGVLSSFSGGMEELINALKAVLGERLKTGFRVDGIEKLAAGGYRVHGEGGGSFEADAVALACPAYEAARILRDFDRDISGLVADIRYPPVSVVSLGFGREKLPFPVDAYGFLIPFKEGRKILGVLYDSSVFPERAPEGHVLLRVMVGGARAASLAMLDDDQLLGLVMGELRGMLGLRAEPDLVRIFRHEKAIPQYPPGHAERLKKLEGALAAHPGLFMTGNAFRGISLNDCIENSFALAQNIMGCPPGKS